ncbi:MAG: insulinase family protein [Alphaproteobacteria bacterium]|nr:insulinase family protein [Alphaproteobacteria bacterium]
MKIERLLIGALFLFTVGVAIPLKALEVERVVSPGGIEAWLVSDSSVPVISMDVAWRGGSITDPVGKEGLAKLVSGLLDEGAGDLDSQAFQRQLEDHAISLSFGVGYDNFVGDVKTLSANRDLAFDLFSMAISAPRFDDEPVERIRQQILVSLAIEQENPGRVARKRWRELVYGEHPYSRPVNGTAGSIVALAKDDLRHFVADRLGRDNMLVAVAGDITAEQLAPLLDRTFGALPARSGTVDITSAPAGGSGDVVVIRREIPQSVAVFGHDAIDRKDPDYYAAYLMAYVLGGGGFNARLTEEVREKRGLAYSVGAYLDPSRYGSLVMGSVGTANQRLAESLELIRAEWRRMADGGVTEQELEGAKNAVIGSYPLRLTSTGGISGTLIGIQLGELGIDYVDRRESLLRAVTVADIQRVAQRFLDDGKLAVVVIGDPAGLQGTIEEQG